MKHPAAPVRHSPLGAGGSRGATCYAGVALAGLARDSFDPTGVKPEIAAEKGGILRMESPFGGKDIVLKFKSGEQKTLENTPAKMTLTKKRHSGKVMTVECGEIVLDE